MKLLVCLKNGLGNSAIILSHLNRYAPFSTIRPTNKMKLQSSLKCQLDVKYIPALPGANKTSKLVTNHTVYIWQFCRQNSGFKQVDTITD